MEQDRSNSDPWYKQHPRVAALSVVATLAVAGAGCKAIAEFTSSDATAASVDTSPTPYQSISFPSVPHNRLRTSSSHAAPSSSESPVGAGSTTDSSSTEASNTSESPTPTLTSTPTPVDILPPRCIEPLASSDYAHKEACARLRNTTIAFVDFGPQGTGAKYDIQQVADLTVNGLSDATKGFISPKAVVFRAGRQARAELHAIASHDTDGAWCVSPAKSSRASDGTDTPLTDIAKSTMPELKNFDMVVSVGSETCPDAETGGILLGNSDPNHAQADVYTVGPAATSNETVKAGSRQISKTAEHESLHIYGLGHSGTERQCDVSASDGLGQVPVVLDAYLGAQCSYDEYGDAGNLMSSKGGDISAGADVLLTDPQRDFLMQTAIPAQSSHGEALQQSAIMTMNAEPDATQSYVTMPIPEGSITNPELSIFTQLDFVATDQADASGNTSPAVEVYATTPFVPAANAKFTTSLMKEVKLQEFSFPDSGELNFTIGNKKVTVDQQPDHSLQVMLGTNDS